MYIKNDYSYIREDDRLLMNCGYGQLSVHSVHFDRYYSEEEKARNLELAQTMTSDEWSSRCKEVAKSFAEPMENILRAFTAKYDIHQGSETTSTMAHYKSNWDLYFWSDRGLNGNDFMTHFKLNFNERRGAENNMDLLEEIVTLVEKMEYANIYCRIQYAVDIDLERVDKEAIEICAELAGKPITYRGNIGKIKVVKISDGVVEYGFFKKNARTRYYPISNAEILKMRVSKSA